MGNTPPYKRLAALALNVVYHSLPQCTHLYLSSTMVPKVFLVVCLAAFGVCRPSEEWAPVQGQAPTKTTTTKTTEEGRAKTTEEGRAIDGLLSWLPMAEYRVLSKVYGDCAERNDFTSCLKGKALVFLDRASRKRQLALPGGLVLVRSEEAQAKNDVALTEEQVEATLPRELGQREAQLDDMIVDRSLDFIRTHALRFDFGLDADSQAALAGDERGIKRKDILPYLLLGKLVASSMVAMAFTGLALLAGKALMVSKVALVLSGIVALKKLFHHGGSSGGGGVEVVNVPSTGHGHYGRSLNAPDVAKDVASQGVDAKEDAHTVAYRGQIQRPASS